MPIPLGVLAVAGAGGGGVPAGNGFELLESQILTSNAGDLTFSNLNSAYGSTYQHLQLRVLWKTDEAFGASVGRFKFNSVNFNNSYATHWLRGNGTNVASTARTTSNADGFFYLENAVPSQEGSTTKFGAMIMDILDPFETTKNTTIRALYGDAEYPIYLVSGVYLNTAAITSIILDSDGSFVSGCRFSLYGMRSS
jgi:hypothetical protein